jgi:hypothetical protein
MEWSFENVKGIIGDHKEGGRDNGLGARERCVVAADALHAGPA